MQHPIFSKTVFKSAYRKGYYRKNLAGQLLLLLLSASFSLLFSASLSAKTLLVLGDSLSAGYGIELKEGWVQLLQNRSTEQYGDTTIINAAVSGDTSGGGLQRLPALLEQHQPDIVIIELGGNDGLRGYPLKQLRDNIGAMIALNNSANAKTLLLGIRIPPNYGRRYSNAFFKSYADLAEHHQVPLVPFFMEHVSENINMMQADGIHPNAAAQPILLDNVWPHLMPLLTEQPSG